MERNNRPSYDKLYLGIDKIRIIEKKNIKGMQVCELTSDARFASIINW